MRRCLVFSLVAVSACGWNPSRPFDRESPSVQQALGDLDAGDAGAAASRLEEYLVTGPCKEGSIGISDLLKRRPDGTFDLGLSLFLVGERYGRRFGEEDIDAGVDDDARGQRHSHVECGRRVVDAIADDVSVPLELRARSRYLDGNLAFLDGDYEGAVRQYDRALVLQPAEADAADSVGRDAAWNRAIALRRIEDKKDAGQDASPPSDGGQDASKDAGHDAARDGGQDGSSLPDAGGGDAGGGGEHDSGAPPPQPDAGAEHPDAAPTPPPTRDQDERMLDQLENAPTLQQEEAKRFGKKRVRGMADK